MIHSQVDESFVLRMNTEIGLSKQTTISTIANVSKTLNSPGDSSKDLLENVDLYSRPLRWKLF